MWTRGFVLVPPPATSLGTAGLLKRSRTNGSFAWGRPGVGSQRHDVQSDAARRHEPGWGCGRTARSWGRRSGQLKQLTWRTTGKPVPVFAWKGISRTFRMMRALDRRIRCEWDQPGLRLRQGWTYVCLKTKQMRFMCPFMFSMNSCSWSWKKGFFFFWQKWYAVIYFTGLTGTTRNVVVAGGQKWFSLIRINRGLGSENKFRFAVLNANSFK